MTDNPEGFFIDNVQLEEKHIGMRVTYIPQHARFDTYTKSAKYDLDGNLTEPSKVVRGWAGHEDSETGSIIRWNDGGVFVDYGRNRCRTDFRDLVWG